MAFRPAVLSYDAIRKRAAAFLAEFHGERTLPVPIEEIVEFDFGIEIIPIDGILDDLEVDAFLTSDLRSIYVDEGVLKHRHTRYRFSLAHEIGHHELHRALYEESKIASVRDWGVIQEGITEQDYAWLEFQANAFAGLILVPKEELEREYRSAFTLAKNAGLSTETLQSEAGRDHIARALAAAFEVSPEVIERRLEKDGYWHPPAPPVVRRTPRKRK